ncbi:MAG: hypothetical protein MRJ68_08340, partial [Nitrospira sp.]|nr:hypothetical protein [Nitrospira sp.]
LLASIHKETRTKRRTKSAFSHKVASGFMKQLVLNGISLLEISKGSANYFFMKVEGKVYGISPFASHEEWWEKPSDGFRATLKRLGCDWGVVLFDLPKREGIWILGKDLDEQVLSGRQKINAIEVKVAIANGVAKTFESTRDFLALLGVPPKRPEKPSNILIRKKESGE